MCIPDKKGVCARLLLMVPHTTKERGEEKGGEGLCVNTLELPRVFFLGFHMHLVYFYYLQIPLSCTPCSLLEWALRKSILPQVVHQVQNQPKQSRLSSQLLFLLQYSFHMSSEQDHQCSASNNFWSPFQCFILNQKLKISKGPYLDLYHILNFVFQCHILNSDISILALPCHRARNQNRGITKTTTPFPHFCLGGREKKASCAMCRMFILLAVCVELFINPQSMICFSFMVLSTHKKYWRCFSLPLKRVIWIITALPMGLNHL